MLSTLKLLTVSLALLTAMAAAQTHPGLPDQELELEEETGLDAGADMPALERMPEVIQFVQAEYPPQVCKQGIEGTVVLVVQVNQTGGVDTVWVERGVHPDLDSSAVAALRRFRFRPAMAAGDSVAVLLQYEYHFSLRTILDGIPRYANVTGVLLEQGTRAPIADAMVVLSFPDSQYAGLPVDLSTYLAHIGTFEGQHVEEDRLVALTDSTGTFTFYSVPAGSIELTFPLPGYEQLTDKEQVAPGQALELRYRLRRLSYSDYEVVVYGRTAEKEVARRQISVAEIQRIPGLGGDAIKVVQTMPGVSRPVMGSGEVIVRGAPTWDSRFTLDGIRIPALYHFGGLKSIYNSNALSGIDFYPGGFGTRYGGATAGAIEITGRKGKTDRFHGSADLSTLDGSFMVEGPLGATGSVIATARRSFIGDIASWYVKNSSHNFPFTLTPFYWDYLVRTDLNPGKDHSLFFTALGSRDSMGLVFTEMPGGTKEIDDAVNMFGMSLMFHMGLAGWDWKISPRLNNSLRYGLTWYENRFSIFGQVKADNFGYTHGIRNEVGYTIDDKLTAHAGVDIDLMQLNLRLALAGGDYMIRRDTVDNWIFGIVGGYFNLHWQPHPSLLIIPGLRYDYFPELDYNGGYLPSFREYKRIDNTTRFSGEPSLRVQTRYTPIANHTIKASVGNYSQTPEPIGQVIMEGWGNPRLGATKAAHYVVGHEWRISDLISSDIQFYWNNQWNIPRMAQPEDLAGPDQLWIGDAVGRMRGVELMLRHDRGERFFGWLAYTYSRSERRTKGTDRFELYEHDEPHHLQLVTSWRLPRQWEAGLRVRTVSGKPTTPVIGRIEDETWNRFEPILGPKNSARIDPFFQADVRVDKKFVYNTWMLSTYIDLQNISWFIYKSPEYIMHDDFYRSTQKVSNIFMPAIGMTAEF